jgi:MFS family permease
MPRLAPPNAGTSLVRFLVAVELFSGTLQGAFPVLLPDLGRTLHFGAGDQAIVLGVNYLVSGIAVPVSSRLIGAVLAHRLARRFGGRAVLTCGFALSAVGYLGIALRHGDAAAFIAPSAVTGFGAGLGLSLLPGLLMHRLPADQTGIGTGVYNTLKTLAGAATGAAGAALLDSFLLRSGVPAQSTYVAIWFGCGALCLLGVPIALALRDARAEERAGVPDGVSEIEMFAK